MGNVLHLARMMADLHLEEFEGATIARVSWRAEPQPGIERGVHFQRHGRRFLLMRCSETEIPSPGELSVSLMLGKMKHGEVRNKEEKMQGAGKVWRSFSYEEVLAFVTKAGDENSIHRGKHAVVPGLLILQELLDVHTDAQRMELRFFHPLYCGEEVSVFPEKHGFSAVAKGEPKFFYRPQKKDDLS